MPQKYQEISETQKEFYQLHLRRDKDKDFNDEFVRTTDLEWEVIEKHGFGGVRLVFEERNGANYFLLGEFPADCPWAGLNGLGLGEFIEADFKAIAGKIPDLTAAMKERCRFIYAERIEDAWKLHYLLEMTLYDGRKYYRIYTGGAPNLNPQPNANLVKFGWAIPRDLSEFYRIHDGFGESGSEMYINNSSEITVMAEMMNPICEQNDFEAPPEYSFADLLEFFPDGAGNAQCFYRKTSDTDALTVDWDHETWEISEECGFYEFINERMSVLDEE